MLDRRTLTFALFLAATCWAQGATAADTSPNLPRTVPVPEVHAQPAGNIPPRHLGDTPVPEENPQRTPSDADGSGGAASEPATPAVAPAPQPAPEKSEGAGTETQPPPQMDADPRSAAQATTLMPPAEIMCRQRLRRLGASFRDLPAERSGDGCALPFPIEISGLGDGIGIAPPAVVNCATAEAVAGFATTEIGPAAEKSFGSRVARVDQASGYVCRPRNGTTKLSEHAFGNALDIAGFRLSDGRQVAVSIDPDAPTKTFLDAIRKAACGRFKTVLGPGSDADHAAHLHLDLAPRRSGAAICE
ncbi:MAG: extensin family protein [Rhizobiaceae bacterium]|nr:extensin family protein [Rhizobiaceae bacterium]